jgi:glycosyltransferase involved in cell wall biosynthesis
MSRAEPRVSVLVRAYNVAPWIEQCLDSILAQKTSFGVEILVHDDASTDGSATILRWYQERYPEQIQVIFQTVNQHGLGRNPASPLVAIARGEFLALCDGDDYWTNLSKLQIQVDRLDQDPSLSIVMHQSDLLEGDQRRARGCEGETRCQLRQFVKQMAIGSASSSILCRQSTEIRTDFNGPGADDNTGADWLLCVSALKSGELCFLHQSMGVYRIRPGSLYSTKPWIDQWKVHIHSALTVSAILGDRWRAQILNYNKRRLLLHWADEKCPLSRDEHRIEFEKIEMLAPIQLLTRVIMSTPLRGIYGRQLSKALYWYLWL